MCTEQLLQSLVQKSYIMKLSLVNLNLSDRLFSLVTAFVEKSEHLVDLDLSWCGARAHNIEALF